MVDQFRKDIIGETPDAHIAKFFANDAAADELSKNFLTSSSLMAVIVSFVRHKTYFAIEDQNTVFSKTLKMELLAAMDAYDNIIEEL